MNSLETFFQTNRRPFLAMNMFMLPPATVATPLKILLFVLIDGWQVLSRALVTSAV